MDNLKVRAAQTEEGMVAPDRPATPRTSGARIAVKRAVHVVADAALRLHRYRYVRARMLHAALGGSRCNERSDD